MDMKELLNKLDSIGSDIAEEAVSEGKYDGKSREELLKMKAQAEADIKNYKPQGDQFYDETQMMMAQKHLDSINDALKKVGEGVEEAVGEFADPIYDLISELGNDDKAHANVLHDLVRYLDSDTIADFVKEFRSNHGYDNGLEYESVAVSDVEMKRDETEGTVKEAMVSLDKGREYFFSRHDFGDENIAYEFNKLARKMSPEDAETLKKELLDMYGDDVGLDEDTVSEADVQETVEVAVDDLRSLIALAGLQPQASTEATTELGEYANSPDEDYQDTDVQINKMSGGLNGPKGQHKKEYPGDNPLAAELAEKLKAMLEK